MGLSLTVELEVGNYCLVDYVTALQSVTSFGEAWHQTTRFYAEFELPWVCFVGATADPASDAEPPKLFSTIPPAFHNRWIEEEIYRNDPTFQLAKLSPVAAPGGAEFMDGYTTTLTVRDFYRDLHRIGARTALTIPLWAATPSQAGFIEVGGCRSKAQFIKFMGERSEHMITAGHYANLCLSRFSKFERFQDISLSHRELNCLQWLAKGLRNDRIAEKLNISLPTVKLHLRNARQKLDAQTREAAVAKAVFMGLIEP
jgi:DNA-binding CsgD family transcriptional regulator